MRTALILLAVAAAAPALANPELATKNGCLACHAVDKKLVGPPYQEVAKRYAGQSDAAARVADSIKKGGAGKWGPIPMPANPNLSDADAKSLAGWILTGAK